MPQSGNAIFRRERLCLYDKINEIHTSQEDVFYGEQAAASRNPQHDEGWRKAMRSRHVVISAAGDAIEIWNHSQDAEKNSRLIQK